MCTRCMPLEWTFLQGPGRVQNADEADRLGREHFAPPLVLAGGEVAGGRRHRRGGFATLRGGGLDAARRRPGVAIVSIPAPR
jgi:hypothetical protein